ncbi:unnamed protein product [Scytosiphon promiscuus]
MSWKEPATAAAAAAAAAQQAAPTSPPPQFSRRKTWWWKLLAPIEWGLGGLPRHHQPPETTAVAVAKGARKFNPGGWLISRWKKTAQFRSNMRWGSLSYIATTWEEEIASTDCSTMGGRAKAGPRGAACDNDEGSGEDAMVLAAFLRKRSSQCLIAGAVVTATVVYALYRNRHKPRRPSAPRRPDGKPHDPAAAATAKKRWWRFAGRGSRGATQDEEMVSGPGEGNEGTGGESGDGEGSAGSSNPELTQGFSEGDMVGGADRQTRPVQSGDDDVGGGGGEDIDGRAKSDGQTSRDRKHVPLDFRDPAPTAFPSPEHHREGNGGTTGSWDGPCAEKQGFAPACGEIESAEKRRVIPSAVEGKGCVTEKGDARSGSSGVKQRRDHSSVCEDARAADTELPREISSSSESSTEDLLAEADSLIAADAKARKTLDTARTTLARSSKHRSSSLASRLGSARATRPRSARGTSGKSRGTTSGKIRSSQPRLPSASSGGASGRSSDPRMPKRARVYREVSGEEVDALVSLTHRALQLEPAALDEIAKDASRQQHEDGESTPSVGELAGNASVVWDTGDGGLEAAASGRHAAALVATKSDLWGGRKEAASNRPVLRS